MPNQESYAYPKSGVDMTQQFGGPKPKLPVEPAPDILELTSDPTTITALAGLTSLYTEYKRTIREAEKLCKPVGDKIKKLSQELGANLFVCDGNRVNVYEMKRKTLSAERLLASGVSAEVIAECMVESKSVALRITAAGEGGEDEL